MLIAVTFKNNDTETVKTKIGKVSTQTARMLYANTFSSKVGIVKGYKKDENTDELSLMGANQSPNGMWRLKFNKGAVSIYGGIGIVEQDTFTDFIVPNNIENYSFGIKVDLSQPAGSEMEFYCKPSTEPLQQDDLQMNDVTGVYEFELFKITTTGATPSTSSKTTKYISSVEDYVEERLKDVGFNQGSIVLGGGFTASINEIKYIKTPNKSLVVGNLVLTNYPNIVSMGNVITNIYVGKLPENFRPKKEVEASFGSTTYFINGNPNSNYYINQYVKIDTSGNINMILKNNYNGNTVNYFSISGIININFGYEI